MREREKKRYFNIPKEPKRRKTKELRTEEIKIKKNIARCRT